MKTETETALKILAEKITSDTNPDEAMKYSQAALNLAHVLSTIDSIGRR